MALPVPVQLSGLIVEKSMRKKDVKHVQTKDLDSVDNGSPHLTSTAATKASQSHRPQDKENMLPKSTQGRLNLITVDAQRISDFLSYKSTFMGTLHDAVIAFSFLLHLIRI